MKQHSLFDISVDQQRPSNEINSFNNSPSPALRELSFDIEATGANPVSDRIVGIALCKVRGRACYVPIRHKAGQNIPDGLNILKPVLEDDSIAKIGHNLKYDILILRQEGIHVKGILFDTMLASYLINPIKPNHSLEDTGLEYLHYKKRAFSDVMGKRHSFAEVPIEDAVGYAAEDAELAMELRHILFEKLSEEGLYELYLNMEMPLIYVLADMEEKGVKINRGKLGEFSAEMDKDLDALKSRIYSLAGEEFNINSPKQISKILFQVIGLQPTKKTKTGYSTSVDVLGYLAAEHELPGEILNYRTLHKLKTTYVDALPKLINKKTGRIHTSFNQTVTSTGRLSSSQPNLQNIPVRGEWGAKIRQMFIAEDGNFIISADYSQVELRILAHLSNDQGLINAFKKDIDIHSRTASELFDIPVDEVTEDLRRIAKTVNFGVVYGISPYGLSEALNISPKQAGVYIEQYFEKHDGVKRYMEESVKFARENGYVVTLSGRKRPIPEINSSNANIRQQAERLAINTPVQGTAADLIKIAMINIWKNLEKKGFEARMLLQIHDELLFESPENEIKSVSDLIRNEMEEALFLSVPLKVDIGYGKNWAEAH